MKLKTRFAVAASLLLCAGLAHAQLVITTNTTIAPNDPAYQNQDIVVRGCTVTINGAQSFNSLTIERDETNEAGIVTHDAGFSAAGVNGMFLTIAGDLVIQGPAKGGLVASRIDLAARGFPGSEGPGAGTDVGWRTSAIAYPAGASYAGEGGLGRIPAGTSSWTNFLPPATYGSVATPSEHGSGGGNSVRVFPLSTQFGGAGGGCVRLVVVGHAIVDGSIITDGQTAVVSGGSGGSIHLAAQTLTGAGLIRAQGGSATGEAALGAGGTGGGGRIALSAGASTFSGTVFAGAGLATAGSRGGAGTIYLAIGANAPQIIIDNAGGPGFGLTAFVTPTDTFDADVLLRNNARLGPKLGTATPQHITITGSLTVEPSAGVDGTARAPRPAPSGSGGQGVYDNPSPNGAGGGGHGGAGGAGGNAMPPLGEAGVAYGDPNAPVTFGGTGGGSAGIFHPSIPGGRGGSALRLNVAGPVVVNGFIANDGEDDTNYNLTSNGAGAGGSLWIEAPSVSGSGFIRANGGDSLYGGGGGGGRIRIDTCALSLAMDHLGVAGGAGAGTGAENGHPGSLVIAAGIADWNHDGTVNSTDVSDFINTWFDDQSAGTLVADFNRDGVSNSTDVSDFINAWFEALAAGC